MQKQLLVSIFLIFVGLGCSQRETHNRAPALIDPRPIFDFESFALAACNGSDSISCQQSQSDQCTVDGSQFAAADYSCASPDMDLNGSEWVQPITLNQGGDVVISVANATSYPFIAVLADGGSGADPAGCIAANWYSVRLIEGQDFAVGDRVYVVVDHPDSGDNMAFHIRLECAAGTAESACDDGFDNDGDFDKDCQDSDCFGTPACPVGTSVVSIDCGTALRTGDTSQFESQDLFEEYECMLGLATPGREIVYTYEAQADEQVVFTVSHANRYPVLAVIEETGGGCMTGDCIAGNFYSVRFAAQQGKTYYLVVDGVDETDFNYQVSLVCAAPLQESACTDDIDSDGDWAIDCEDADCLTTAACSTNQCITAATLDCSSQMVSGDTAESYANSNINDYSCLPTLDLGNAEVAYEFSYQEGPAQQEVLITLANETGYATVAVLGDVTLSELDLTIENNSNADWSQGLVATTELITPGATPQPGDDAYYTYAFTHNDCDLNDSHCGAGCDDDGDAVVLANRLGLTLDSNAWIVPALAQGESTTITIRAQASTEVSYVSRVVGSMDDLMAMHVLDDVTDLSVPLSDDQGDALTSLSFAISGYDVNSRYASSGDGRSCSSQCPPPSRRCYVAYNNGTTGGQQQGQSIATEVTCSPSQCVAGNYYDATFTAKQGKTYWVVVEADYPASVAYDLSVVCAPTADESEGGGCSDQYDNDGDNLIDCQDSDCAAECSQGDLCQPTTAIDCSTRLLPGTTDDPAATNAITSYSCEPTLGAAGAEYTYTFTADADGWVNFTTSNLTGYATVGVLEDTGVCDPYYCQAAQYYSALTRVTAGTTYFVVVDGMEAGSIDYSLSVICNPPLTETTCDDNIDNDADFLIDCYDPDCSC